jgi:hypothetical protein
VGLTNVGSHGDESGEEDQATLDHRHLLIVVLVLARVIRAEHIQPVEQMKAVREGVKKN